MSAENNRSWITNAMIPVALTVMGLVVGFQQYQTTNLQDQINNNSNRLWEQQRVAVTEEKLNRSNEAMIQLMESKFQNFSSRLDLMMRQMDMISESMVDQRKSQEEFKKEIRAEVIKAIRDSN